MSEPKVPDRSSDELEVGWGDDLDGIRGSDNDSDEERLRAERPPHHDRD